MGEVRGSIPLRAYHLRTLLKDFLIPSIKILDQGDDLEPSK